MSHSDKRLTTAWSQVRILPGASMACLAIGIGIGIGIGPAVNPVAACVPAFAG
jgi:hypothetical protein